MTRTTLKKSAARAKKMRQLFAAGSTVKQLLGRFRICNAGALHNLLTGRDNENAGGRLVKTTRRRHSAKK